MPMPDDCKKKDGRCVEHVRQGNYGVCKKCTYTTRTVAVEIILTNHDYHFLRDLCVKDKTDLSESLGKVIHGFIMSAKRHMEAT